VIFTDLCSRAVHIEVVFGYDTQSCLLAFFRFTAVRGCPSVIYSDPGSQLVGASEELKKAWREVDREVLLQTGAEAGLKWIFGPAESPWHQGAVEALVKVAKKAITFSVREQRLSTPELLTVFSQVANLLNERPLGLIPGLDSELNILTPNSLLLGRSCSKNPGIFLDGPSLKSRLTVIKKVVDAFWKHWTELYAPVLVRQTKWREERRNLVVGDVVIVADSDVFRGSYRLARVIQVFPGADGMVRRARIAYKNYKVGENVCEYSGVPDTVVERSVQKLALLVPVD
jgi:hypothetical protein